MYYVVWPPYDEELLSTVRYTIIYRTDDFADALKAIKRTGGTLYIPDSPGEIRRAAGIP